MNSIAEISEQAATGRVSELYADIKHTQQLPLVNLIWRHLATNPDALEWAWTALRPLYAQGVAAREASALYRALDLPVLPTVPIAVTRTLGLSDRDIDTICTMLDTYNHGNGLNLIALSALFATPQADAGRSPDPPSGESITSSLPALPALSALPADVQALVLAINQFGTDAGVEPIVASLYRHLGHWPTYLALAWTSLAPLTQDGRLTQAMQQVKDQAEVHARRAATHRDSVPEHPAEEFAKTAMSTFIATAISRMVPIGLMLRAALNS